VPRFQDSPHGVSVRPSAQNPSLGGWPGVSEQTGPSMSTEPGWKILEREDPHYLGSDRAEITTTPACC
jgi:hypothetical protein